MCLEAMAASVPVESSPFRRRQSGGSEIAMADGWCSGVAASLTSIPECQQRPTGPITIGYDRARDVWETPQNNGRGHCEPSIYITDNYRIFVRRLDRGSMQRRKVSWQDLLCRGIGCLLEMAYFEVLNVRPATVRQTADTARSSQLGGDPCRANRAHRAQPESLEPFRSVRRWRLNSRVAARSGKLPRSNMRPRRTVAASIL
jgi:hypothetical protein